MKTSLIKLFVDSRDAHAYQKFGSTLEFADNLNFHDPNVPAKTQSIGNVECTCYACEYIAQTKTKKEYDIDELFSRIPHDGNGADPRAVLGEVVKNGFLIKGTTIYDKPFSSYWRADTGPQDAFDNVRSAIILAQAPIVIWSNWYAEWENLSPNEVMPVGKTKVSAHMYAADGWATVSKIVNIGDEPMFVLEWWGGFTTYMPRPAFNAAMSAWGCGAAVLSTVSLDEVRIKSIMESIIDVCKNLILLLRQKQMTIPAVQLNSFSSKIIMWADGIKIGEGADSALNNPGNLKVSSLTESWGAINGRQASDGGWLAKFPNYTAGFTALCNFLKLGCEDELKAYHQARTLQEFTEIYAGHPPFDYIQGIANHLGVALDTDISTFL